MGGFIRFRLLLAYGSIFPGTMELTVRQKQMQPPALFQKVLGGSGLQKS